MDRDDRLTPMENPGSAPDMHMYSYIIFVGNTPLLAAASEGHEEIVQILLEEGSNALMVNNSGSTGLHLAAYQRNVNLVKVFV